MAFESGLVTGGAAAASVVGDPAVAAYLPRLLPPLDPLLQEMREHADREGIPIVADDTARLLELLVRIRRPRHVLEFGTAIGYSTVWMARALDADAGLTSLEIDPTRYQQATDYLERAERARDDEGPTVSLVLGDARSTVGDVSADVDFAFLDATKDQYEDYLRATLDLMPSGGVVVVDNALLSGTVARGEQSDDWSRDAVEGMRSFNERFVSGAGIEGIVLAVGDGVAVGVRT